MQFFEFLDSTMLYHLVYLVYLNTHTRRTYFSISLKIFHPYHIDLLFWNAFLYCKFYIFLFVHLITFDFYLERINYLDKRGNSIFFSFGRTSFCSTANSGTYLSNNPCNNLSISCKLNFLEFSSANFSALSTSCLLKL